MSGGEQLAAGWRLPAAASGLDTALQETMKTDAEDSEY